MFKELLSDFSIITQSTYLPDTFSPYLSIILTIIALTIVVFSVQTISTNLHTYAATPVRMTNVTPAADNCVALAEQYPTRYIASCAPRQLGNTQRAVVRSIEHALHNPIN